MPTDKEIKKLVINVLTEEQYDSATKNEDEFYLTPDDTEEIEKVIPTDVSIKDGKIGLVHDTVWLTNQNAINLGNGLAYDETTNTLKAEENGKVCNLFGKHSILVPKDSTETNIDLFIHNIVLKDNADTPTKQIFLTIESSSNIVVDSLTDLNTLLTTNKRVIGCSGYTATDDIKAIDWQGTYASSKYITKAASTSLSDFTVISDSITTI